MRKRFFIALGLMFVVTVVFALRLLNDSLPGRFGSSDSLLSQVTPGPNEALYFVSPSSGSHNVGNTFQVELRLASSAGVTSMKAYLNFNSSLLQVTNVSTTGGAFQTYWEATSTSNQVRLQGSSPTPGVSGNNNLVATITFQALAAGTASLTYDASSLALKSDDTNILNIGGSQTGSYTLVSDTTAPSATISINSGGASTSTTSVTLSLTCTDTSGVKDVRYSNDGVFDTEVFEAFAASKAWSLSGGDGTKTVSYQCRDNSLNQNIATVSDTIVFDTTAPSVPSGISYSPNPNKTGTHTVSWNASLDSGSGVAGYDVRRSLNGGGSWTTVASGLAGTNFVQSPAVGAGTYIYQARAVDNAGNQSAFSGNTNTVVVDLTAPTASISINSGASSTSTASVTLSLTCTDTSGVKDVRYSNDGVFDTEVFEAFAASKAWSLSGGDGTKTVSYQCRDVLDNAAVVSDAIALDTTAPARTLTQPGDQPAGTTSVGLSLTTNENATCRISTTPDTDYDFMSNTFAGGGTMSHSGTVSGLSDGNSYTFYVRCEDALGNENATDTQFQFSVASPTNNSPVRTLTQPGTQAAGTTSVNLSLTTNENATCRYSLNPGTDYDSMPSGNTFSGGGTTSHSSTVSGLSDGNSYTYYVRCVDSLGEKNSNDDQFEFSVALAGDTTAPSATISINSGGASTSTASVTLSLTCTDTSGVKDVRYSNDGVFDTEVFEAFAASKAWSLSGGDGTKTVSYQCRDNSLNQNIATVSDTIVFDTTAPSVSGLSPSGQLAAGTSQTEISLSTGEAATCRYSTTAGTSYDSMTNTFTTTGGTSHSTTVTGLSNGNSYSHYVRCADSLDNKNTTDSQVAFSVSSPPSPSPSPSPGGSSPSPSPSPSPSASPIKGDCNADSKVNIFDLSVLLSNWGKTTTACDLNSDGKVSIFDLSVMLSNWTN